MGHIINPKSRLLSPDRKQAILSLSTPKTKKKKSSYFLRCGRLLQNLISGFKLKAKPLYEATKDPDAEPLLWTREQEKAFNKIKQALTSAFALGVPPFLKIHLSYMKLKDRGQPWRSLYKS